MDQLFGSNARLQRLMAELRLENEQKDEDKRRRREAKGASAASGSKGKIHVPRPPTDGSCAINWLSPEILDSILSLVADLDRADMRETCLVSRAWRRPSQAQLWTELVFLPMDEMLEDILQSGSCGKFKTEDASFQGALGIAPNRSKLIEQLVSKMHGLKTLRMSEHENLDPNLFLAPTLSKLSDLTINHSSFGPVSAPISIDFRLSRFEITGDSAFPSLLLASLLTPAFSTLTTLALNLSEQVFAFKKLASLWPSFAPTLTRLELGAPYPTLIPLLAGCTSLDSLRLASSISSSEVGHIFAAIRSTISTLELCINVDEHDASRPWKTIEARRTLATVAEHLEERRGTFNALSELREFVFALEGETDASLDGLEEMREIREVCWQRCIEVIVDETGRDLYDEY